MNILIPTIGSRGDVQPFIALAQGLKQAGHQATVASHPVMRDLVESHGVMYTPIGPDIDLAREAAAIRQKARNPTVGLMKGMQFGLKLVEQSHEDILALCEKVDLVVVSAASAAGKNEADKLGKPYLSVTLMPWAIPWDDPERPFFTRVLYGAIDGLAGMITTRPLNKMRKRQGLPPVGKEGFTSKALNLVPVSPAVYQRNPLWEAQHRVVGYWFAEAPGDWAPQKDLTDFLNSGDPPVLISLGAMSLGEVDEMENASLFVDAIKKAGVRAIIQGWETAIAKLDLPPEVHAAGSIPHNWLLPYCAGIVHHGGFGTTAAGLRAGIPALVIPHMMDQFYWGKQVAEMGVGPPAIKRTDLDAKGLAGALKTLVKDDTIRRAAEELGEKIRSEEGVEAALRVIEEVFL